MKYVTSVEAAITQAAPLERFDGAWVPSLQGDTVSVSVPLEGEHDFPLIYPSRDEVEKPYKILVDTPSEVKGVMAAYEDTQDTQ